MVLAFGFDDIFNLVGPVLSFGCMAAFVVPLMAMHNASIEKRRQRARLKLDEWAKRNGYVVLSRELGWFGPFLGKSANQIAFRIVAEDRERRRRQGWALCGGWLLGLLSDQVQVRWDEPEPPVSVTPAPDPMWDRELDPPE